MEKLKLEELLRYAFSGALLLISLVLTHPKEKWGPVLGVDPTVVKGIGDATVIIAFVLLIGSSIYVLHRAVAYPILWRLALGVLVGCRTYRGSRDMLFLYRISAEEARLDLWRLGLKTWAPIRASFLSEWGAQVHFLYCSGWAILVARILGSYFANTPAETHPAELFRCLLWIFFLGGFVHHLRLLQMIAIFQTETVLSKTEDPISISKRDWIVALGVFVTLSSSFLVPRFKEWLVIMAFVFSLVWIVHFSCRFLRGQR